jgi:hypothetical protein
MATQYYSYLVKGTSSSCLATSALPHEDVWRSGLIEPRVLHTGTSWDLVLSITPRLFYPLGKSPWYPLDRKLSGPRRRSWSFGEGNNCVHNGTRHEFLPVDHPASRQSL